MSTKRERRIRLTGGVVSAAFLAIALAGCSGLSHPEDFPADGQGATVTSNPQDVRAEDFGRTWPLSVTSGTISCSANADGGRAAALPLCGFAALRLCRAARLFSSRPSVHRRRQLITAGSRTPGTSSG